MFIAHFSATERDQNFLSTSLNRHTNLFFKDNDIAGNLDKIREVEVLSVFIYDQVTEDVIANLPNLKIIVTRSTGFDHINLEACKQKNIKVYNVPFYGENTVAEHAFALLLSISKNIYRQVARTRKNVFEYKDLLGFDLAKKTLGIIGTGHIGIHAIKIAKGFGMDVIAFDVVQNKFLEELLDFKYVSKEVLFAQSDIISLHAPYNKNTHHMLNKEAFEQMKDGVTIINTSRGGLIHNQSLIEALDNGKVGNAGLDVLEGEELLLGDDKNTSLVDLITRDNVIFTPHTAFYTKDAEEKILQTTVDNILGGETKINSVF